MFNFKKKNTPKIITSPELEKRISDAQELEAKINQASATKDFALAQSLQAELDKTNSEIEAMKIELNEKMAQQHTSEEVERAAKSVTRATKARAKESKKRGQNKDPEMIIAPNATQEILPFEALFADGIVRLDSERYSKMLMFDDVSWITEHEENREITADMWGNLLDSIPDNTGIQLWQHSTPLTDEEIAESFNTSSSESEGIAGELVRFAKYRVASSTRPMNTERGMIFTVLAEDVTSARHELESIMQIARKGLVQLDSDSREVDGRERVNLLRKMTRGKGARPLTDVGREVAVNPNISIRELVAPTSIVRPYGSSDLQVSNRWVRTYCVLKYSSTVRDSLMTDLTTIPFENVVSQHIRPWDKKNSSDVAAAALSAIETEENVFKTSHSRPEVGFYVDEAPLDIRTKRENAQKMLQSIDNENQRLYSVLTTVTVFADSPEELKHAGIQVESIFGKHRFEEIDHWASLREQSFASALPLGSRELPAQYDYAFITEALKVYAPFSSVTISDDKGALLGFDADTKKPILYDQALREDSNIFVLGQPGGGKSVWTKLLTIQRFLREPNADIIMIDPESEYQEMVYALNGQNIDLSDTSENHINLMDMSEYYGSADPNKASNPLPAKINFLNGAVSAMTSSFNDYQKGALDKAAQKVYAKYLESKDEEDLPTLTDLYNALRDTKGSSEGDANDLADLIERYTTGSFSVFNNKTNVNLNNRLVNFVISDLSPDLKPLAMMVIIDYVWNKVIENRKHGRRTYLVIDEMQLIMIPQMLTWLDQFFSRGRKWDFYITCITQDVTRLKMFNETEFMQHNTMLSVLMKQDEITATALQDMYRLSAIQKNILVHAPKGEGLYVLRGKVIHFDFILNPEITPRLFEIISTTPADRKRKEEEAKKLRQDAEAAIKKLEEQREQKELEPQVEPEAEVISDSPYVEVVPEKDDEITEILAGGEEVADSPYAEVKEPVSDVIIEDDTHVLVNTDTLERAANAFVDVVREGAISEKKAFAFFEKQKAIEKEAHKAAPEPKFATTKAQDSAEQIVIVPTSDELEG